jgi:hypothetical protein
MVTKLVAITELKTNPNNPRTIKNDKFKKLVQSIKDFPKMLEIRPIVVNEDNIVLGGNMRLKACIEAGLQVIPVINANDLTPEEQKQFIIKDNVGFGEWDFEELANNWDDQNLNEWGLDIPDFVDDVFDTEFTLPEGDKAPFQQMTFTLADEQAIQIKNAIDEIKHTEEFKYAETMGNENSNGNAIYLIIMQWAEQKKS